MPEEQIHGQMQHRPERYEETVDPDNPPAKTGIAAVIVAGMWYYLAPLGILLLTLTLAFVYWSRHDSTVEEEPTAPTTGVTQELPGGKATDPKLSTTEEELKYRGER